MSLPNSYFKSEELIDSVNKFQGPIDASKSIAIIGAGLSGLIIGNELVKRGFEKIALYEQSGRIGGRIFTHHFSADPAAIAEVGAMRVPQDHYFINFLIQRYGLKTIPFPDALKSDTCIFFDGKRIDIKEGADIPQEILAIKEKWKGLMDPIIREITEKDFSTSWDELSKLYKDKSFFEVLREKGWSEREMHILGSVGVASGGLNTFFENSFLEVIKMVKLSPKDRMMIVGGFEQIPQNMYNEEHEINGKKRSLASFHPEGLLPGVRKISKTDGKICIEDVSGNKREFDQVIITCALRCLELDIQIEETLFPESLWAAIRELPTKKAEKIFLLTKSAFWKDPEYKISTTITDLPIRQIFLFDETYFGKSTPSGMILVSYSFGESSLKMDALSHTEKIDLCLENIKTIYGEKIHQKLKEEMLESFSFSWDTAEGFYGAYKMSNPGQENHQETLYSYNKAWGSKNGIFLSGEAFAWQGYGGWMEGALQAGFQTLKEILHQAQREG